MVLAFESCGRSLQFLSNASANLLVFVAKCLGVSWDPLGLAWVSLGPFWDSLGTHWDPLGSDPWIGSMVLFDLKRKIDFLMSFRDFAELSFFSRASGDNFLRSFFLTCWCHLETLRSSPFFVCLRGSHVAICFLFFWRCVFLCIWENWSHECRTKMMTGGNWWLMIDHWSRMIDDW